MRHGPRILLGTATALTACAGLHSQGFLHSPAYMGQVEGRYHATTFGGMPAMRYQLIDAENRTRGATLKDVSFRLDYRSHSSALTAAGRTWSSVTLDLCDSDLAKATATFSANRLSTPTTVFSGKVTWPDYNGLPLTKPTAWGGAGGAYTVTFQSPWVYAGKQDILTDWTFAGGKLTSGQAWSTAQPYWFDGYGHPDHPYYGTSRSVPKDRLNNDSAGVRTRCNDSAMGALNTGSYANLFVNVYSPDASDTKAKGNILIWSTCHYSAPKTPLIHAWSLLTHEDGIWVPTGCNRIHVVGLTMFLNGVADQWGMSRSNTISTPWADSMAGLKVTMQGAWADSKTGQLRLSQAEEATLPAEQPPDAVLRTAVWQVGSGAVQGPDRTFPHNPILQYTR